MAKRQKSRPHTANQRAAAEDERTQRKKELQRRLREERQINQLVSQLFRAMGKSDRRLRELAQHILERDGDEISGSTRDDVSARAAAGVV